jgi:hypothetical protein
MRPNFSSIDRKQRELEENMRKMQDEAASRAASPSVTMTGRAAEVSQVSLDRQDKEKDVSLRAMRTLGIEWAMAEPVRVKGSRVNEIGVENFTMEGEELLASGPLTDNLRKIEDVIEAEDRRVAMVRIQDLILDKRGDILIVKRRGSGRPGIPVNPATIESICNYFPQTFSKVKQGMINSYQDCGLHIDQKIETFNRHIRDHLPRELGDRDGTLAMVVRKQRGEDQTWTVRGPRNTANEVDGLEFCRLVRGALKDSGMYGEVEYNPENGRVAFSGWTMPNVIIDLSAGDVFKAGISGSTNDCKSGKYKIFFDVVRNLCHNLIILSYEGGEVFSATHNSKPERVIAGIRDGLKKSDTALDGFKDLWGTLRSVDVPELEETESREQDVEMVLREIAAQVRQPGTTTDAVVEMLLNSWEQEPGYTFADVHNAVSRLYLEKEIDAFTLAQKAGELLPVLVGQAKEVM